MYADSLLHGVRQIDHQGDQLLTLRMLSGPKPRHHVEVTMSVLLDIAELLRANSPLPLDPAAYGSMSGETEYRPDGGVHAHTEADTLRGDGLVSQMVEISYEQGPPTVDGLDAEIANRVAAADRLETVGSWVIVPLSATPPYALNWRPVIETILDRLDGLLDDYQRVARRARSDDSDRLLVDGLEAIVEMLDLLSFVIQRADATSRYVRTRTDHRQDELLSTVAQTTTQLWRNDDA